MNCLVYDLGLFVPVAEMLGASRRFEKVWYYTPTAEQFLVSKRALIGAGLDNVVRVQNFWDYVPHADVIVFPDVGSADLQTFLRDQCGKMVWGSAHAEVLELERSELKRIMKAKRMAMPKYDVVEGMDALRELLEENDERFVKISRFRGDLETYHHINWFLTEPWWNELSHRIGPMREIMEFVVEQGIEGVEIGYDGFCVDGEFPAHAVIGYEHKDAAYVGKVVSAKELPAPLADVNRRLAPLLKTLGCRSAYSNELRVKGGQGVLIDPCMRFGSPPSECMLALIENWDEIILLGANGSLEEPKFAGKFAAEVMLLSPWAEDNFLAIDVPDEVRERVKLYNHTRIGEVDYIVPSIAQVGAAVGVGNTLEDAKREALEVANAVKAHQLTYDEQAFDRLDETIEEGIQEGIDW